MLAGSRFGASLIVLLVGFVAYLRGRRNPDGIYVGVIALLTTWTVYLPATLLALALLRGGVLERAAGGVPSRWGNLVTSGGAPLVEALEPRVAGIVLFALGVGALLAAFWLFDRLLPNLDPPSARVERLSRRFASPRSMFFFGLLLTALTMSVAISVTILVPLTLKGIVHRRAIVPYVMGANITTFVDTLFAATLVLTPQAVPVVLAQVAAVTAVSAVVLLFAYGPYSRLVLAAAHAVVADRRWMVALLAAMGGLPLLLLSL
jgi:Na+/phosphate symporter